MIRRPPRSTQSRSSAASDVYKRQDDGPESQSAGSSRGRHAPWQEQVAPQAEQDRQAHGGTELHHRKVSTRVLQDRRLMNHGQLKMGRRVVHRQSTHLELTMIHEATILE